MDGIIILLALCALCYRAASSTSSDTDVFDMAMENVHVDCYDRPSKLNEEFYYDDDAFMEVAHDLGF